MKVGILTYHFAINYGAVLQCYALQEYLKVKGCDVEVIDFTPMNYRRLHPWQYNNFRKYPLAGVGKMLLKWKYGKVMIRKFDDFRTEYMNLSKKVTYDNFDNAINNYDAVITGSDQVWGPSRLDDLCYFFDNTHDYKGLKISYAPCCAVNNAKSTAKRSEIASLLNEFHAISVRNIETAHFVNDLIGIEVPIVTDPTLLHDFSEITNEFKPTDSKYILTYILGSDIKDGNTKAIEIIKKHTGINTVYSIILTENAPKLFNWASKKFYVATPIEWLRLFYNASFVYTDSFHGVIFALKFKKPFVTYYTELNRSSRFMDLKTRFKLKNIVTTISELSQCLNQGDDKLPYIDGMYVNIQESEYFLNKSLTL